MVAYLRESVASADRIAQGDLATDVTPRGERDALGHALANMVDGLRSAIGDVAGSATTVASASQQMAVGADETGRAVNEIALAIGEIAQGAEDQVRSVADARTAVDEVSASVQESAQAQRDSLQMWGENGLIFGGEKIEQAIGAPVGFCTFLHGSCPRWSRASAKALSHISILSLR